VSNPIAHVAETLDFSVFSFNIGRLQKMFWLFNKHKRFNIFNHHEYKVPQE